MVPKEMYLNFTHEFYSLASQSRFRAGNARNISLGSMIYHYNGLGELIVNYLATFQIEANY